LHNKKQGVDLSTLVFIGFWHSLSFLRDVEWRKVHLSFNRYYYWKRYNLSYQIKQQLILKKIGQSI